MTGGKTVILGLVGRNFAAGMSGGLAYILDREKLFKSRCNTDMVDVEPVDLPEDKDFLRNILQEFYDTTGSELAKGILDGWPGTLNNFWKVSDGAAFNQYYSFWFSAPAFKHNSPLDMVIAFFMVVLHLLKGGRLPTGHV